MVLITIGRSRTHVGDRGKELHIPYLWSILDLTTWLP